MFLGVSTLFILMIHRRCNSATRPYFYRCVDCTQYLLFLIIFQVVDARAGPGTKSMMKMKSRNKEENKFKKKHKHRSKHRLAPAKPPCSPGGLSDDILSMYSAYMT